jgi:crotonobetainyl-CoA:carnitine CoA-transferase CaiB-like acyl-CoA transferase
VVQHEARAGVLLLTGTLGWGSVPVAVGLAAANVAAGVMVHQMIPLALRRRERSADSCDRGQLPRVLADVVERATASRELRAS